MNIEYDRHLTATLAGTILIAGAANAETLDCTFTQYTDPHYKTQFLQESVAKQQRHVIEGSTAKIGPSTGNVTQNDGSRLKWRYKVNFDKNSGTTGHYKYLFIRSTGKVKVSVELQGDYYPIQGVWGTCVSRN